MLVRYRVDDRRRDSPSRVAKEPAIGRRWIAKQVRTWSVRGDRYELGASRDPAGVDLEVASVCADRIQGHVGIDDEVTVGRRACACARAPDNPDVSLFIRGRSRAAVPRNYGGGLILCPSTSRARASV